MAPRPLPEPGNGPLTCFLVSTSRMSIRLIMMFLCVFLYFPTRSETVSQPGRPVHMKVLLPCSFHSRTCNRGTEAQLAPPEGPQSGWQPCFQERKLGGMPSCVNKHLQSPCHLPGPGRHTALSLWNLLGRRGRRKGWGAATPPAAERAKTQEQSASVTRPTWAA